MEIVDKHPRGANQGKIEGLDGVRALAVLSVVISHLGIYDVLQRRGVISTALVNSLDGSAGVQAFFVLSGFLITRLLISEQRRHGKISLFNFYVRRSLRIFPLYFLVILLLVLAERVGNYVLTKESLIFAVFYITNFIPKDWYVSVVGHTWSLAVEEHFYFVWPFVFITLAPNYRSLSRALISFVVVSTALAVTLSGIDILNSKFFVARWSFVAGSDIALGALLSIFLVSPNSALFSRYSAAIICLGVRLVFCELLQPNWGLIVSKQVRGLGFALVIGWIVVNQKSLLTKSLSLGPLSYLGKISYGIYMWQGFFLSTGPARHALQTWPPDQRAGLMLLILTAPISYHFFEKPILNLKHKLQRG